MGFTKFGTAPPYSISAGLTLRSHRVFTRRVVNASDDVLFTRTRVTLTSSIIYVAVARTAAFFLFFFFISRQSRFAGN